MAKKIEITEKQLIQFNRMRIALLRIKSYQTINQLQRGSEADWGLDYIDALEMAYENIIEEAKRASKGIAGINHTPKPNP